MYQVFISVIAANFNKENLLSMLKSFGRLTAVKAYFNRDYFYVFVKYRSNESAIRAFESEARNKNFFFTYTQKFQQNLLRNYQPLVEPAAAQVFQPNLPTSQLQIQQPVVVVQSPWNAFPKKKPIFFFNNLDYKIRDTTTLEEMFGNYGNVHYIRLIKDSNGIYHKGHGFVFFHNCFEDPEVIVNKCQNKFINGRKLIVELSDAYKRFLNKGEDLIDNNSPLPTFLLLL